MSMLFHGQNATMISNIVKFDKNYDFLKKVTYGFNPAKVLANYSGTDAVEKIVEALREKDGEGLVWDSSKSNSKDSIAKRYAKSMLECAAYLARFLNEKTKKSKDIFVFICYNRFIAPAFCFFLLHFPRLS